jgi:addiction module HigA family antidote
MAMHNPPHPGEIIQDILIDNNALSITAAAEMLSITRATLSKIINRRSGISPEMAIRLSIALNTSSEMWLTLQMKYDLWQAEQNRTKILKKVEPLKAFKIKPNANFKNSA